MGLASGLYCMLWSLRTLPRTGLKPLQHVEGELCPLHFLGAHGGSGSDPALGSQGLAARLLRAVADRQQPGSLKAC